ncbi:MAG: B12-binding domain-containing radical SAM protein [Elusimicrobia bacterium]|nr:B12-binding domain-containing radical SAM protein [Elusimicrobiota bacterium]
MRISLLTIPVEVDYSDFVPQVKAGTDVFVPSIRSEGQLPMMPKIAIVSLVHWMEAHGYSRADWDFFDVDMLLPSDQQLLDYFKTYKPDVVGLSAVVSTCYAQVKRISRLLRHACPDALIVLGGSLTASSNLVLRKTDVDLCVVGDGEIAWVGVLDYAKTHGRRKDYDALDKIKGLAFLDDAGELQFTGYGAQVPGDHLPFPDYEILKAGLKDRPQDMANYFRRGLGSTHFQTDPRSWEKDRRPMLAQLWSSKGCVARCTFCQRSTKGYRIPRIDELDAHLKMLAEKYDVGFIHILDENFSSDKEYAHELARTMVKNGMLWMASGVRVSSVGRDDIRFYKDHNCVSLKFGVETGSQKIMDVMEKKFTVGRVFETLKHCADAQLYSPLAVMVGMPGETNQTAAETGRYLGRLAHMQGIAPRYQGYSIFYALPLTGTPLYVYGQQLGLIGRSPDEEERYLLSVSGSGANKVNYVNLNGAKLRDVIWWDWLVKLEAEREFRRLSREQPLGEPNFLQKTIIEDKKREVVGRALTVREVLSRLKVGSLRGLKHRLFYWVDDFMEHSVVPSPLVSRLPRWLAYPFLRSLVYGQYLLQKAVLKALGRRYNLFEPRVSVAPLGEAAEFNARISRSLRSVVRERVHGQPAPTKTEATQELLAIGL